MKRLSCICGTLCLVILSAATSGRAQSLTEKLEEGDQFYLNYGKDMYSRLKIEKDVIGHYDYFGEHITDGLQIYGLKNYSRDINNERRREGEADSVEQAYINEFASKHFQEKFSNLVVTQDAIGGTKMAWLIGDQITTKFTPLTFNKTNFKGIRFDLWSSGLQFSGLISQTRPGVVSMKSEGTRESWVNYPTNIGRDKYERGIRGDAEMSNASPHGDFEWLWSVHAENTIANKVDVGLTYINHHVSDVRKGEKWFKGNIPESWMPGEIHFEFYDGTPLDTTDAGVYVYSVEMYINGDAVEARPQYVDDFRLVRVGEENGALNIKALPIDKPKSGNLPVIVAYSLDPRYWQYKNGRPAPAGISGIKTISFKYSVAGNYLVFVSTDKQIPLSISGEPDPQTKEVQYEYPDKSIKEIYEHDRKRGDEPGYGNTNTEKLYSTTYFGEYIAKSPRAISVSQQDFAQAAANDGAAILRNKDRYNFRTYEYQYGLNVSSVTYGLNFRGELGGVDFSGEVALNQREDMLPGSDESRKVTNKWTGVLKAQREIGKNFGLSGDLYYISPQWQTSLENMQTSRFYSKTNYSTTKNKYDAGYPDYLDHPKPFNNGWRNLDDNEDGDAFVENDRRHYPAERNPKDDRGDFHADGVLRWDEDIEPLTLPTSLDHNDQLKIAYDDPDGVVASKDDKNRNGTPDYLEDFLLFSSDPPVFELGSDLNNNGVPDWEDDDILPDYGYSVGYVLTADGIKTQGIKGLSLNLRYTPRENLTVDVGGRVEGINDRDLVLDPDFKEEFYWDESEGRSLVGYLTAKQEVIKRSQGLQYQFGGELRAIRDGIRNDIVKYSGRNINEEYEVTYLYYTDPLKFRQAVVGNVVGSVIYNNVRNFEYAFKASVGGQKHFRLENSLPGTDGEFFNVYTLYNPNNLSDYLYKGRWELYQDRLVGDVHLVKRASYRIGFNYEFEDWRKVFNALNRLEIIPQYKINFSMTKELSGPNTEDPRDLEQYLRWFKGIESPWDQQLDQVLSENVRNSILNEKVEWYNYQLNNNMYLLNVPIIRSNYKIGESSELQVGFQWKRMVDFLSKEENYSKFSWLAQIVSRASYKGYTVTFFLGAQSYERNADVNVYNPVLGTGKPYDMSAYEFFARIYSG